MHKVRTLGFIAVLAVCAPAIVSTAAGSAVSHPSVQLRTSPCVELNVAASVGLPAWESFSSSEFRRWIELRGSATYTTRDASTFLSMIGPAGWRCNVVAGEDGSGLLAVGRTLDAARAFEAGHVAPTSRALLEAVQLGCYSCQWGILCPILLRAGIHAKPGEGYGGCNRNHETRNELLRFLKVPSKSGRAVQRLAVLFWAPPQSHDVGTLSKSSYWTRGVIETTYMYKGGAVFDPATVVLSCQLPRSMAGRCRSLEGWFLSRR
jgi:hypothetical protein